jgi:putative ABC transport system permease protein
VGTLALGIAASTAIFSLADAVLLAPLPYEDPQARVMIWNRWRGFDKTWTNPAEARTWMQRCPSLAEVAYWQVDRVNLTGEGGPLRAATTRERTTRPSRSRWRTRSWESTVRSWRWSRRPRSCCC